MTPQDVLLFIALAFAAIEEFNAKGRSILGWAVVFICVALLWASLVT